MPLLECFYHNRVIHQESIMHVIVPQEPRPAAGFPVLYLLHGLSENHSSWLRKTNLEQLAADSPFLIVMADAGRSFYTGKYWQFFAEELPSVVANMFPIDARPESTFVAGQSMGAFGALKLALRFPERFRAAAAMAPVIGVNEFIAAAPPDHINLEELQGCFGDFQASMTSDNHLVFLTRTARIRLPIYLCCGDSDFLLSQNQILAKELRDHGYRLKFVADRGCHSWEYFNNHITPMINFFIGELNHVD